MGLLDLTRQVKGQLPQRFGGTGNKSGYGTGVVVPYLNVSGGDIPVGSIVTQAGNGGARMDLASGLDSTDVVGVLVGYYPNGDGQTISVAACPDYALGAVMIAGRCRVLVAENVAKDEYVYQSSTDGQARGDATVGEGALGVFESTGDSGLLAYVRLFGAPVFGAGGSGVTWGTPALSFSTSAAAGSIDEAIRRDSTLALFDGTAPVTQAFGDSAATGSAGKAARRDHKHGMPAGVTAKFEVEAHWVSPGASSQVFVRVPYNCTLTGWDITANASGSAVVDVWMDTYAAYPPTVGDSIAGSAKPTLSGARKAQNTSLSGWGDTTLDEGSYLVFNVDSVSGITELWVTLYGTRTIS